VISDLHLGDGSRRDHFAARDRASFLNRFLDHVEANSGQLLIIGDLLELWRFRLDDVLAAWRSLFDRFEAMGAEFVLGNHDCELAPLIGSEDAPHPFIRRARHSFTTEIGPMNFKFLHGHEVDPFIPRGSESWGKIFGILGGMLEMDNSLCTLSTDAMSDVLLACGEHLLSAANWVKSKVSRAVKDYCAMLPNEQMANLKRGVRTRKMLARFFADRARGLYDIAIAGHTHKAGSFNNWYFNCGSWTGKTHTYLQIRPDATVQVFYWLKNHPYLNHSLFGG